LFSSASCRLDGESAPLTRAPTLALSLSWATVTSFQTSLCEDFSLAANFTSRLGAEFDEELNTVEASLPRWLQRPCSTQKASIEITPECGGRIRSTTSMRSCAPPFTISPDWTYTSS